MTLREAVRTIIREVAEEELRKIVHEVLLEELMGENPRITAAKKAAATRAANRNGTNPTPATPRPKAIPKRAKALGVAMGQQYRGKKYAPKIRHRIIEIVRMDDRFIYPKVIGSAGKRASAKRISYDNLLQRYDRIK